MAKKKLDTAMEVISVTAQPFTNPATIEASMRIGEIEALPKLVYRTATMRMKPSALSGSDFLDMCDDYGSGIPLLDILNAKGVTMSEWVSLTKMAGLSAVYAHAQEVLAEVLNAKISTELDDTRGEFMRESDGELTGAMVNWTKQRLTSNETRLSRLSGKYSQKNGNLTVNINGGAGVQAEQTGDISAYLDKPIGDWTKASQV